VQNGGEGKLCGGKIMVAEDCFIGGDVVVLPNVIIGRKCIVEPGTVVSSVSLQKRIRNLNRPALTTTSECRVRQNCCRQSDEDNRRRE
jgi:acetyltransferase-like isoleucine patch superfamily enzyme